MDRSLFETSEGEIFCCGLNIYSKLMLKMRTEKNVYPPTETTFSTEERTCSVKETYFRTCEKSEGTEKWIIESIKTKESKLQNFHH